ncbi:hypothetical protein GCM10023354_04600 [Garicola koreensis]
MTLALVLSACGTTVEEDDPGSSGGGSVEGSMDQVQVTAPQPAGDQHSHDRMREALEDSIDGAEITDTDDWWGSLRDLNRELQKLRVEPAQCKSFVTSSALPVPSGALTAIAQHEQRQTAVYSFEDPDEAQTYANQEAEGAQKCDGHTVTRELDDEQIETETALDEVEVRSGAEDALAVSHAMEAADETQRGLTVLLRYGSTVVVNAATLDEPLDEEPREELAVDLEAQAAAVLSTLTGEEVTAPEPEPEDDEGDAENGDDGADSGNDDEGGDSGEDQGGDSGEDQGSAAEG